MTEATYLAILARLDAIAADVAVMGKRLDVLEAKAATS